MTEEEIKAAEEEKKEIQREEAILAAVTECVRAMRRHGVNTLGDRLKVVSMFLSAIGPHLSIAGGYSGG